MLLEEKSFSHYKILRLIGRGGAGEVYLAQDLQIPRQVAVKFLRIEEEDYTQASAERARLLFWREASAVAKLDHANILPLYEYGTTLLDNSSLAFLIIPYCPEGSLSAWLRQRQQQQPIMLDLIEHIVQQAALGLQCAHDHQIIHLDVKPANFLIRSRVANDAYPDLLLSDFGIARLASATSSLSQHIRGTPSYMAPEQWAGQPTFASDQYALGIMTYELLTGNPPFQGAPLNVMYAHIHTLPRSVCELHPYLPDAIDLILQRALHKDPEQRYPSIIEFAQAFEKVPGTITLKLHSTIIPSIHSEVHSPPALPSHQLVANSESITPSLPSNALPAPIQAVPPNITAEYPLDSSAATRTMLTTPEQLSSTNSQKFSASFTTLPLETTTFTSSTTRGRKTRRRVRVAIALSLLFCLLVLIGAGLGAFFSQGPSLSNNTLLHTAQTGKISATPTTPYQHTNGGTSGTYLTPSATPTASLATPSAPAHAYPGYLPGHGTFSFFDPLSRPDHWQPQEESDTNGKCLFSGGALESFEFSYPHTFHCDGPAYSNFAFEVQMTILKGDCGGISLRKNAAAHNFYQFDICLNNRQFYFFRVTNNNYATLQEGDDSPFITGVNQTLLLAVVAQGASIKLYINRQFLTSVQDTTYTQGDLALTARDDQASQTEVMYKNATVWIL